MKRLLIIRFVLICLSAWIFFHTDAKELKNSYMNSLLTPEHILKDFIPKNAEENRKYQILLDNIFCGDSLFMKGEIPQATRCYDNGLNIANELNLDWQAIIMHNRLGFTYYWSANFKNSDIHYEASRKLIDRSNSVQDTIAVIESFVLSSWNEDYQVSDFLKSMNLEIILSENLNQFSNTRQAKLLFLKALLYNIEDKYNISLSELYKAQQLLNPQNTSFQMWHFLINLNQASNYYYCKDYSLALELMKELYSLAKSKKEFVFFEYYLNTKLGAIYSKLNDYHNAKNHFLEISDIVSGRQHINFAEYYINFGYAYERLGYPAKAMDSYKLAEKILDKNSIQDERLALLYWYLASLSRSMNNEEANFNYLNKAEQILQIYPDPILESYVVSRLGNYYRKREEYGLAIFIYNLFLDDLDKLINDDDYFKSQYQYLILSDYQSILKGRAHSFYFLSKSKNFKLVPLKQSYQDLKKLLALKMKILDQLNYEQSKKTSLYEIRMIYNDIINIGYDLYSKTRNDSIAYELFEFSERGKAHLLKGFMSDELAKKLSGIPEHLIQQSKEYQKEIDSLQYNLKQYEIHNDFKNDFAINNILSRIEEYDQFIMQMEKDYPKYLEYKEEYKGISISRIQNSLKPEQALLEYYFTFNAFYIFYFDNSSFKLFISPVTRNFPKEVLSFRKLMAEMEYGDFSQVTIKEYAHQSYNFYKLMIEPVEDLIEDKRLIIIPDGELILIPFESLVKEDSDDQNKAMSFKDLDYLIKSNPICYLYSASQLLDDTKIRNRKITYAGFAPDYSKGNLVQRGTESSQKVLRYLPGAIEEVLSVKQYFKGKAFIGEKASKKRFFKESKKNDIIHLAMHTFLDTEEPMNSELIFSSDYKPEKQLHAYEVYAQELTAKLIVLSACNTGTGEVVKGEGVFNLARAFIQAGVKNVVITQWSVADQSSVNLMERFYYYLSEGHPVDIALQRSKIDFLMRGDPVKTQPFFWAPFVCYGNPISMPKRNHTWPIAIGSILGIVLVLLVLKLRFKLF